MLWSPPRRESGWTRMEPCALFSWRDRRGMRGWIGRLRVCCGPGGSRRPRVIGWSGGGYEFCGRWRPPRGQSHDLDGGTTSSSLPMSFPWHGFLFMVLWRMESLARRKKGHGKSHLSSLWGTKCAGPRLVFPSLWGVRREASAPSEGMRRE